MLPITEPTLKTPHEPVLGSSSIVSWNWPRNIYQIRIHWLNKKWNILAQVSPRLHHIIPRIAERHQHPCRDTRFPHFWFHRSTQGPPQLSGAKRCAVTTHPVSSQRPASARSPWEESSSFQDLHQPIRGPDICSHANQAYLLLNTVEQWHIYLGYMIYNMEDMCCSTVLG